MFISLIVRLSLTFSTQDKGSDYYDFIWGDLSIGKSNRPPDVPECGFHQEFCKDCEFKMSHLRFCLMYKLISQLVSMAKTLAKPGLQGPICSIYCDKTCIAVNLHGSIPLWTNRYDRAYCLVHLVHHRYQSLHHRWSLWRNSPDSAHCFNSWSCSVVSITITSWSRCTFTDMDNVHMHHLCLFTVEGNKCNFSPWKLGK